MCVDIVHLVNIKKDKRVLSHCHNGLSVRLLLAGF